VAGQNFSSALFFYLAQPKYKFAVGKKYDGLVAEANPLFFSVKLPLFLPLSIYFGSLAKVSFQGKRQETTSQAHIQHKWRSGKRFYSQLFNNASHMSL
jgi:hypothetical protein